MNVQIALFFHICGVLMLFGAALIEITSVNRLRRATSISVARAWVSLTKPLEYIFPISVVVIILSGLYQLHENPDFKLAQPWAMTVLVFLVALSILGAGVNTPRLKKIAEELQEVPHGPIPPAIRARIQDPILLTNVHAISAAILGAVLIMTVKPGLRDSIIIVIVSLLLGAAAVFPMLRAGDRQPPSESPALSRDG